MSLVRTGGPDNPARAAFFAGIVDGQHGMQHANSPQHEADMVKDDRDPERERQDVKDQVGERLKRLSRQEQRQWRAEKGQQVDHRYPDIGWLAPG